MEAVSVLTIKNKIPLYKGEEKAERIELIQLEEVGFELVAQKDLYQVGDKAVYIQPDYSLSDIPLFESFIRPGGDESKSMLGKVGGFPRRIRAKKFNFHTGDGVAVYSNGILLPLNEVVEYLGIDKDLGVENFNLTKMLDITKYEEPENNSGGNVKSGSSRSFPENLYKTDEENINNLWNHIENKLGYPIHLVGSEKVDGSSITVGVKDSKGFICSRNLEKPLVVRKTTGRRKKTLFEKILFWTKPDLNIYNFLPNDDDFVKYGKPYLDLLLLHGHTNTVLRGELSGGSLKGSGNKNNPARNEQPNIKFFGVDFPDENFIFKKASDADFKSVINHIGANTVKEVFSETFNSKEELLAKCNEYFSKNMIEGIVVRTLDSKFSAKIMNLEYDSKK